LGNKTEKNVNIMLYFGSEQRCCRRTGVASLRRGAAQATELAQAQRIDLDEALRRKKKKKGK
jgi:hypothetical protein